MIQQKLRDVIQELRRTPMPLANIIPLLQEAADELDEKDEEIEDLQKGANWLSCLEAAGVDNWDGIDEAHRIYREDDDE
jgi:hypothetical protein